MVDLAKLVVKLEAQSAQYLSELDKANKKLDSFGKKSEISLGKVAKSTALLGLGVAAALTKLGLAASENIDEFGKMAERTGISTESLSQLGYVAKLANTDIDGLEKGIIKLSKSTIAAAQGSKEAKDAFSVIGVTIKDAGGKIKSADKLLLEVADRFAEFEDGPAKAALALQLFGKSGVALIPFLNQGGEAIRALMKEADAFGQTVTGKAAAAADQFNDNLDRLKLAAKGVVNQAFQRLLPALQDYTDETLDAAKNTDDFNRSVEVTVNLFKLAASAGVILKGIFNAVGQTIGVLAAAFHDAFKDFTPTDFLIPGRAFVKLAKNMAESGDDIRERLGAGLGDVFDGIKSDVSDLESIWQDEDERLTTVRVTVKKLKQELKFTDKGLAEGLAKQADAAIKKLQEIDVELKQQVATFGEGSVAVTEYSLNFGKLADEVGKAGEKGQALRESILATTIELEKMKNANAVQQLDIDILQLTGHFKEASTAAFDLQNATLKSSLQDTGDTAGLEKLNRLRELTTAQASFNELQEQAQRIQDKLARSEQSIQNEVLVGAGTELGALEKTGAAREDALAQLEAIRQKMLDIATASGNPELVANVEKFGGEIDDLAASTDLLGQKIRGEVTDSVSGLFKDFITGSKTAKEAVLSFIADLGAKFAELIAQNWAEQLLGSFGGNSSTGGGSNIWSSIASIFGGTMDSGGMGQAGKAYMIGTGAQPEMFVPGMSGHFIPRAEWGGGGGITQHFAIQAPQGSVSRATELQIGAAAARGIGQANRRNN